MPIHDWSGFDSGIFHDFHQVWTIEIRRALNAGLLPPGYFALADQFLGGPIPDVVTLQRRSPADHPQPGGIAVADAPPQDRFITSAETDAYASKANRIVIRHQLGEVVAVIEIVSPGNKSSQHGIRSYVNKTRELLDGGINLLVVDLFPPSSRDPQGIHKAIWDEIRAEPFELPADKPLTVAAYQGGEVKKAYVEPVAVGDVLPSLPIFLSPHRYVPAPLEETYRAAWAQCPEPVREMVTGRAGQ